MEIRPAKFAIADIETKVNWINNDTINSTMFFDLPATIERTKQWFENNIGNKSRVDFTFKDCNDVIIAMGGFTSISEEHSNAEFYIMVNPDMQGKGIGTKTSYWMYNYAFSILGLNKIYLFTNNDNKAAYKLYEKAGFILEGVLRQQKYKNNKYQDRRFYGLLRKEWEGSDWKKTIKDEL